MPNEKVREANIEKALETGILCLKRDGVNNLQLKTVAEVSGISKRSLLRYFGNRENFIREVLERSNNQFYAKVLQNNDLIFSETDSAYERAQKQMYSLRDNVSKAWDTIVTTVDAEVYLSDSDVDMSAYQTSYEKQITAIEALLEEGRNDGSMTKLPEDTRLLAEHFCYGLWGIIGQMALMVRMKICDEAHAYQVITQFINETMRALN